MGKKNKNKNRNREFAEAKKKRREESEQAEEFAPPIVSETDDFVDEEPQKTRPIECRFNEHRLDKIDKFGLLPLTIFALASVIASFINIYEWGRNMFGVLFMALGAFSLAVYEIFVLSVTKNCKCSACRTRIKTSWILLIIGLVGFVAGLSLFIVFAVRDVYDVGAMIGLLLGRID